MPFDSVIPNLGIYPTNTCGHVQNDMYKNYSFKNKKKLFISTIVCY